MGYVAKIMQGVLSPEMSSRRQRLGALFAVACMQSGVTASLFALTSPLRAVIVALALPCAVAIFLSPHLGAYMIAAILIGHWPWGVMRYFGMLVAASTFMWLFLRRERIFPFNPILLWAALFTGFVLISTISPRTRIGLWTTALAFVGHFTLVWIFVALLDSRSAVLRVVQLMVLSGVATAVIGLIQWRTHFVWPASTTYYADASQGDFVGKSALELQGWLGQFRIDSITGTPDMLPLYLQTLMPFVAFWLVRQHSRVRQVIGMLILALFGVVHFLSFTRGAILTTLVVVAMIGWMIDKRRMVVFGPTLALVGFAALMSWEPMRERIISLIALTPSLQEDAHLESSRWRLAVLPIGVKVLFERPLLGMGAGQQRYNWPPSARHLIPEVEEPTVIHNSYLQIGIEIGIGGLTALLVLMMIIFRELRRLARRFLALGDCEMADVARASLIAFLGIALAMMAYPMLDSFRYFWLLAGLTGAMVRLEGALPAIASRANA